MGDGGGMDGGMGRGRFYGKYRGKVASNVDPLQLGRVQVTCPEVLGDGRLSWALPAAPFAGPGVGFFALPPVGANVWVEFESGDPDYPIWAGCFWTVGQVPAKPAVAQVAVLKTAGVTLELSDLPGAGGLKIDVGPPAVSVPVSVRLGVTGIELKYGKNSVKLTAASVKINDGALEII